MPRRDDSSSRRDDDTAGLRRYTDQWAQRNNIHITKAAKQRLSKLYGKSMGDLRAVQAFSDSSVFGWLRVLKQVQAAQDELHRQLLAEASGGRVTQKTLKSVLSRLCPGFWPFC